MIKIQEGNSDIKNRNWSDGLQAYQIAGLMYRILISFFLAFYFRPEVTLITLFTISNFVV